MDYSILRFIFESPRLWRQRHVFVWLDHIGVLERRHIRTSKTTRPKPQNNYGANMISRPIFIGQLLPPAAMRCTSSYPTTNY